MKDIIDMFEQAIPVETMVIPEHTKTVKVYPRCFVVSDELYRRYLYDIHPFREECKGRSELVYNGVPIYRKSDIVEIKE